MKTLVVYSASWCVPCKQLKKVISETDLSGLATVEFVDVEEDRGKAVVMGIRSVPTMVLFDENSKEVKRKTGVIPSELLLDFVN